MARPMPAPAEVTPRQACVYKVDRIGDFVVALGAIHQLIDHFGANQVRLVVSDVASPVAAAEFPNVARWVVPPDASGVWREMRAVRAGQAPRWAAERFEHLVALRHARSLYRDVSLTWIHAVRWHGTGPRPGPKDLTLDNQPRPAAGYPAGATAPWSRELLAHRAVVASATGRDCGWDDVRPRFRSISASAAGSWVFCPFGSDPIRDYAADAWVAAWQAAAIPAGDVALIGPGSRARDLDVLAWRLGTEAKIKNVRVLMDLPTLEFVRVIAAARAVFTVESAAAHLATAFDKPAVILIGGGHHGWLGPWGDGARQHWLTKRLPCFGCSWSCPYESALCLDVPAAAVTEAMKSVASLL